MQRTVLIVVQDATHRRVVQDHFPGVRSLRHGVRWPCGPLQHRRQRDRWGTAADSPGSPIANDETGWATASDGTGLDAVRSKTRDAGTDCNTTGDAPSSARTDSSTGSATAGDGTGLGAADDATRSKPGAAGTACNTASDASSYPRTGSGIGSATASSSPPCNAPQNAFQISDCRPPTKQQNLAFYRIVDQDRDWC